MVDVAVCRTIRGLIFGLSLVATSWSQAQMTSRTVKIDLPAPKLNFSKDGTLLRAIGLDNGTDSQRLWAFTYAVDTGKVLHSLELEENAAVLSTTADGKTAVISIGGAGYHSPLQVFLLDTETGKRAPVPSDWFDPDTEPDIRVSADGGMISVYRETGPESAPLQIAVYRWSDKTLIATRSSEFTAAGGVFGGGITPDGNAVEFDNNRSGTKLVDLKTGRSIARFRPDSIRSSDGKWVVEMPDSSFVESSPRRVLIKGGRTGKIEGEIKVRVSDEIAYGQMSASVCDTAGCAIVAAGRNVARYALPSGRKDATFPPEVWSDPQAQDPHREIVACSEDGTRAAILSGSRLTLYSIDVATQTPRTQGRLR